jgi:hypothetical protein
VIDEFDRDRIIKELSGRNYYNVVILDRVDFFSAHNNHYDGYWVRAEHIDYSIQMLLVILWEDMFWVEPIPESKQ